MHQLPLSGCGVTPIGRINPSRLRVAHPPWPGILRAHFSPRLIRLRANWLLGPRSWKVTPNTTATKLPPRALSCLSLIVTALSNIVSSSILLFPSFEQHNEHEHALGRHNEKRKKESEESGGKEENSGNSADSGEIQTTERGEGVCSTSVYCRFMLDRVGVHGYSV